MLTHFTLTQPLSLDNALSSYQIIHKLITQMNEVIDEVNNIDSKAFEYTDREIIKLHNAINTQLSELEDLLQSQIDVNTLDITDLKNRADNIEGELININNRLVELREYVDNEFLEVRNELNTIYHSLIAQMNALREYVEELIKRMTVKVYSNYDGCKKDIKEALNDLYNYQKKTFNDVSFAWVKRFLGNCWVNSKVSDTTTYNYPKDWCTLTNISASLSNMLNNIMGKDTYNPNYTNQNEYITVLYQTTPKISDLKYNSALMIYCLVLNCLYRFNGPSMGQSYAYYIMCNKLMSGMYSGLGLGYLSLPTMRFGGWYNSYN